MSQTIRCFPGFVRGGVIPDAPTLSEVAAVDDANLEELSSDLLSFL
jgi:hypothetical protein